MSPIFTPNHSMQCFILTTNPFQKTNRIHLKNHILWTLKDDNNCNIYPKYGPDSASAVLGSLATDHIITFARFLSLRINSAIEILCF